MGAITPPDATTAPTPVAVFATCTEKDLSTVNCSQIAQRSSGPNQATGGGRVGGGGRGDVAVVEQV